MSSRDIINNILPKNMRASENFSVMNINVHLKIDEIGTTNSL